MSSKITKKINVDLHDSKYISINAKQYDKESRFVLISCYNNGDAYFVDKRSNYAYIRYKKPDDFGVFNSCEITNDGKILVELTEQMLSVAGKCCADIIIASGEIEIDAENDVLITSSGSILTTMTLCVNVIEAAFDNVEMESSYEYNGLNDLVNKALAEYNQVITICKSLQENAQISEANAKESEINAAASELKAKNSENNAGVSEANAKTSETNAKLSETNASVSEVNAKESEVKAKESEENSKVSEENAKLSENNAKTSETNALSSETKAKDSENNASASESNAGISEANAKESEEKAKLSEINASNSETNASNSENNAKTYEESAGNYADIAVTKASESSQSATESAMSAQASADKATEALDYATLSKSYAVGETNTRENEDIDNSKYYYTQTKSISDSLGGVFSPRGSVEFSELQSVEKFAGCVYHVEDAFVTDDTFKNGAGISFPSGTNVYYTADGYWDCFSGKYISDDDFDLLNKTIENLNTTIVALENRIKALEEQTVLGITD